jgi:hypothetical protein
MVNINIQTKTNCFNGWDKKALSNHIGKLIGLKNAIFNLYIAVYQNGGIKRARIIMIDVEYPSRLLLWQFRLRTFNEYEFISKGFYIDIGQLICVLKF